MIKRMMNVIQEMINLGKPRQYRRSHLRVLTGQISLTLLTLLGSFVASSTLASSSKDPKVSVTAEPRTVAVGEEVDVTVSVSTPSEVDIQDPKLPNLNGFLLRNSSTSSSFQSSMVQGQGGFEFDKKHIINYSYSIEAQKEGPWTIGPIEVVVDGKPYKTPEVKITVVKAGTKTPQQKYKDRRKQAIDQLFGGGRGGGLPPSMRDLFDEENEDQQMDQLFGQLQQRVPPKDNPAYKGLPKNEREAFFVTLELDKTDVYEGEQIFANWYIYTRGNILQLDRLKFPDLKGFWKEDIEAAPNIIFQQEIVNGVPFKKALLASHALFPIKAGGVNIDEYKIRATVSLPSFGGFGFGQPYQYTRSSENIKINAKPLPPEGRPASFSGAVGTYDIRTQIEEKEFFVGQPFSLKVRFEGEGNAKFIELPPIEFPGNIEKYDVQSEAKFFKSGQSYKEFNIVLIPREEGKLTVPSISFSFFNTATKKYEEKKTEPIVIQVQKAKDGKPALGASRFGGQNKTKQASNQLPPLLTSMESDFFRSHKPNTIQWIIIYLAILVVLFIQFVRAFELFERNKSINELLKDRIKAIHKDLEKGNLREVGIESVNLINLILGQLSGLGGSSLEIEKMLESVSPSIRRDMGPEILKSSQIFQTLAFGPENSWGSLRDSKILKKHLSKLEKDLAKSVALSEEKT